MRLRTFFAGGFHNREEEAMLTYKGFYLVYEEGNRLNPGTWVCHAKNGRGEGHSARGETMEEAHNAALQWIDDRGRAGVGLRIISKFTRFGG